MRGNARLAKILGTERPQRATGVVYSPDTDRFSHYLSPRLARQFDAVVHLDTTRAVAPV